MSTLTLNNVSKVYQTGKTAIADLNLSSMGKEFLVVVGPSGCGKTTLLRLIAGLETATKGDILMDEIRVNLSLPHMSAYDNIAFELKIKKTPKQEIEKKVMEAADILGIRNELKYRPRSLSGGQCQRVALGRAMVSRPKFFLLDEPLSNLDAKLRAEMRSEIMNLYEKLDATFIYVTHDQIEAMTMGSRMVVLNDGVMQQIGTPSEIYNHPINKFVAGFIGSPEMNFLYGVLLNKDNGVCLTVCGEKIILPGRLFDRADKSYLDGKRGVIAGIRPEDIVVFPEKSDNLYEVKAAVKGVDVLGKEMIVYTKVGGASVAVKTTIPVKKGDNIKIAFDIERMHFFSAVTGMNIIDYGT